MYIKIKDVSKCTLFRGKNKPLKGECSQIFLNNRVEWVDEWIIYQLPIAIYKYF